MPELNFMAAIGRLDRACGGRPNLSLSIRLPKLIAPLASGRATCRAGLPRRSGWNDWLVPLQIFDSFRGRVRAYPPARRPGADFPSVSLLLPGGLRQR